MTTAKTAKATAAATDGVQDYIAFGTKLVEAEIDASRSFFDGLSGVKEPVGFAQYVTEHGQAAIQRAVAAGKQAIEINTKLFRGVSAA